MFFKILAPERLKGAAGPVQGVEFCKVGMFTAQVAPFDVVGCNSRIHVTGIFHVKCSPHRSEDFKIELSLADVGKYLI